MPLLWISLAFVAGLLLGTSLPLPGPAWLAAAGLGLGLLGLHHFLVSRSPRLNLGWLARPEPHLMVPPLLLLVALMLGAWRITASAPDLARGHIAAYNDQGESHLIAVVDTPPDRRDTNTRYRLRVEQVALVGADGQPAALSPAHGMVLVVMPARAQWQYGDRLVLDGDLTTPPEDETFSYRAYLARQNIYSYLAYPRVRRMDRGAGSPLLAGLYQLRAWAYAEVFHLYPSPEAPLLAGILLGDDSDLPDELARAFQDTGTAHIIAISGFNIAILIQLFSAMFRRILPRWWALAGAILAVTAYSLLVGGTASVVRAAIMGSLALIAQQIGRRTAGANTLAFTAALMCLDNPHLPWDVSFQLSFGATLGLILYGDRWQHGLTALLEKHFSAQAARRAAGLLGEYVLMTLAAQALTLPVILYHFNRLSLTTLIANPLLLPPQPLVMVLSGAAVLAGAVSDPLAHALAWLAWPLSAYTNRMVEALGSIPNGVLVLGDFGLGSALLMYGVVLAPAFSRSLPGKAGAAIRGALKPTVLLIGAALFALVTWRALLAAPDGRLHLIIYDLNGSQAILMRGPGGETVLINGGASARSLNNALDRWLSPIDRRLDGLLINTDQSGLWGGLAGMLGAHPVTQVWWGIPPPESRPAQPLLAALEDQPSSAVMLAQGSQLTFGSAAGLRVLTTTAGGSALLLTWDRFRALIPAGNAISQFNPDEIARLSLIVLDERDLAQTSPQAWLALDPQAVIAAAGSPTGLPAWVNTPSNRWIEITTDGHQMWVEQP